MKRILIVYHSQAQGNTRRMAELVAEGCRLSKGIAVELINVNEHRVDMKVAEKADAYALGSPDYFTLLAGGLKQFFDDILLASRQNMNTLGKPYVAFLTHGGGGGAIKSIDKLAEACKLQQVAGNVLRKGAPEKAEDVEKARALGAALAAYLTREA